MHNPPSIKLDFYVMESVESIYCQDYCYTKDLASVV